MIGNNTCLSGCLSVKIIKSRKSNQTWKLLLSSQSTFTTKQWPSIWSLRPRSLFRAVWQSSKSTQRLTNYNFSKKRRFFTPTIVIINEITIFLTHSGAQFWTDCDKWNNILNTIDCSWKVTAGFTFFRVTNLSRISEISRTVYLTVFWSQQNAD